MMRFRVLLVDDEKTALDSLEYLIQRYHPEFSVVGRAKNGIEALRDAEEKSPDLVLTDIRMPHMDGLDLAERLQKQMPEIYVIIISGYADFEYVRKAMIYGSIDYLLKPVAPQQMKQALDRAKPFLEKNLYKKRVGIVHKLCKGYPLDIEEQRRYFPEKVYCAAITRKNGLPSRISQTTPTELFSDEGAVIDLYGRDEMESLYIFPSGLMNQTEIIHFTQRPFHQIPGYVTTIIWKEDFDIEDAPSIIQKLYQTLSRRLVVGKSQTIFINTDTCEEETYDKDFQSWDNHFLSQLIKYLQEKNYFQAGKTIEELMVLGQKREVPQFLLENTVRMALYHIQSSKKALSDFTLGFMIDDIFSNATSFQELGDGVQSLAHELSKNQMSRSSNMQTMFDQICLYMYKNMSEPLNLQRICKQFGISQPTLSRLFQEHVNLSFNRFLTKIRIEKSIQLLTEPSLLIRDVAEKVGYSDQFYFSRIFRSIVGMSPTEYMTQQIDT